MLLLTAAIWGAAFVAQSAGMDYVGPFTFNSVRCLIGGMFLIPCIFLLKHLGFVHPPENSRQWRDLAVGGSTCGVLLGIASAFQQIGISQTTVSKAGFITALYVIIVPVLGLFVRKKVPAMIWVCVGLSLVGVYLLCMSGTASIGAGDIMVFLCAIVFSFHILAIDYFSPKADGVMLSCIQFFVAGIVCGIPMLLIEHPQMTSILAAWQPILYAGILSCGVAYTLQVVAQARTDPTVASLILCTESVFSAVFGWVFLHQSLSIRELAGCTLMFIAILLANIKGTDSTPNATE